MITTFDEYLKANPVVFPDCWTEKEKAHGGIYAPVARLQKFWDWAELVCNALVAGEQIPHAIVEFYLDNPYSKIYALPPNRRADYPDLAKRFPICYIRQPNGEVVQV
jgi:hypothetical protein